MVGLRQADVRVRAREGGDNNTPPAKRLCPGREEGEKGVEAGAGQEEEGKGRKRCIDTSPVSSPAKKMPRTPNRFCGEAR